MSDKNNNVQESTALEGCLKVFTYLVIGGVVFLVTVFAIMCFLFKDAGHKPKPRPPVIQSIDTVINDLKACQSEAQVYFEKSRNAEISLPLELNIISDISRRNRVHYSFIVTENAAWVGRRFIERSWESRDEVKKSLASRQDMQFYGSDSLDLSPLSTDQKYRYRSTDDVIWILVEDDPKKLPPVSSETLSYAPRYVFDALQAVSSTAQQYLKVNSQDAGTLLSRDSGNLSSITEYLISQDIRLDLVTFRVSKSAQLWAGHNLAGADIAYRKFFAINAQESRLYGSSGIETPPDSSRSENSYKEGDNAIWIRIPSANASGLAMDAPEFLELCRAGSPEEVEHAIQNGADINERYRGYDLLYEAREKPEVVAVLLRHGANVNVKDKRRGTVLTSLLRTFPSRDNSAVILMLLEAGAEFDSEFSLHDLKHVNATPEVVRAFISRGLDVNAMHFSPPGNTLIFLGSSLECSTLLIKVVRGYGNLSLELIPVLLDMGADANIRDINDKRAIDYAEQNKLLMENTEIYQRLKAATSDDIL